MAYSKTTWVNKSKPSINSENLNKIEDGIYQNSLDITSLKTEIEEEIANLKDTSIPLSTTTIDTLGLDSSDNPTVSDGLVDLSTTNAIGTILTKSYVGFEEEDSRYLYCDGSYIQGEDYPLLKDKLRTNLLQWSQQSSGVTVALNSVAYGNNMYVVVGANATILISTDAVTWTPVSPTITNTLSSVAFGNGVFIAVGNAGVVIRSENGTDWDLIAVPASGALTHVAYGDGIFAFIGSASSYLYASDDYGLTFTQRSGATGVTAATGLTYCSPYFIMGTSTSGSYIRLFDPKLGTSGTWVTTTFASAVVGGISAYCNGIYVNTAKSSTIRYSTDAITWTSSTLTMTGYLVTVYRGVFVLIGTGLGTPTVGISGDGATWTLLGYFDTVTTLNAISSGTDKIVIVGSSGQIFTLDCTEFELPLDVNYQGVNNSYQYIKALEVAD